MVAVPRGCSGASGGDKDQWDLSPLSWAHWAFVSAWLSLKTRPGPWVGEADLG